jgi:hypothetical protein
MFGSWRLPGVLARPRFTFLDNDKGNENSASYRERCGFVMEGALKIVVASSVQQHSQPELKGCINHAHPHAMTTA